MKDIVVINSLRSKGNALDNIDDILRYEAIERKPRVLDKAPKKLTFSRASKIVRYGCYSEFLMCFDDLKANTKLEQAVIDLPQGRRFCDVPVYIALQTLVSQGYTSICDRASACFTMFKLIVTTPGETVTVNRVAKVLQEYQAATYYEGELLKALQVCLLNEKASVVSWVASCDCLGFYNTAIQLGKEVIRKNCDTEEDVKKFLKPLLKEAKQDENFMSEVYKPAANNYLIPILFYLKDKHPEALSPDNNER